MALENYPRLRRIVQTVSDLKRRPFSELKVVDLGCAHGYYTLEMARRGADALGIEGREEWVRRANDMKSHTKIENARFVHDDARNLTVGKYGTFDVVLCLGLLYHLDAPDVFEFLSNISQCCTDFAIIDTQIAMRPISTTEWRGETYSGWAYEEHPSGSDRIQKEANLGASLDDDYSFWLTRASLLNALKAVGFTSVFEAANPLDNMYIDGEMRLHCDVVTLIAKKGEPIGSFIGAIPGMKPAEDWPEDATKYFLERPYKAPWSV